MSDRHLQSLSILAALTLLAGCNPSATLFSDELRNLTSGNVVPLTPGQPSNFVFVRLVNETQDAIQFVVTAERQFAVLDEEGNRVIQTENETVHLNTFPLESVNEIGALFDCPVTRVGLGDDLNSITSPGLFVLDNFDPEDPTAGLGQGAGVTSGLGPLDSRVGNFGCGDTLVFRVIESQGSVGNLQVQAFVLLASTQPTEFTGPHTFNNARNFIESQVFEEN